MATLRTILIRDQTFRRRGCHRRRHLSELAAARAAKNRTALEALAKRKADAGEVVLEQTNILKRLLRIVKRG